MISKGTIALCVPALHSAAVLATMVWAPDWSLIIGFPSVPLVVTLLERFDPTWANYSGTNPVMEWLTFIGIWVGNFAFYAVAAWVLLARIHRWRTIQPPGNVDAQQDRSPAA